MKFILLLVLFAIWGCTKTEEKSWQGIYYPGGCLNCDSEYVYSPIFKTFNECKNWAETKKENEEDKASCGRSCEFEGKIDMSKCDLVVRSWYIPLLSESPILSTYKE